MPQINTNVWGDGFGLYADYINKRSGTNDDITNIDYTNYPPFCFLSQNTTPPAPENFTSALRTIYARGGVNLNTPIDESICYVGMFNSDLPQLNMGVYYVGDTQENPTFKTDNTKIQSFFLYGTLDLFHAFPNHNYMPNGFIPVPDYTNYAKYVYWSPNAETSNYPDTVNYNTNLKIDPYLKWGLKSFFLVIYVVYISSYDGSGQPLSTQTTLNNYLNGTGHDDTWKTQHPVMCAFAMPYIRRSTSGEYNTQIYGYTPVIPAFTMPFSGEYDGNNYDIISYIATLSGTAVDTTAPNIGHFPIYGSLTPWQYQYPYAASTNRNGAAMLGINKGTYKKAPSNDVYWFELDLTDPDNVEYLMRGCAAYGLFFSDDYYTLNQAGRDTDRWIDNNMCCGTIDENGRTNGDYTRGLQNMLQRQFDWSDSTESPFDPSVLPPDVDPNHYSDSTSLPALPWAAENVWTDVTLGSLTPKMQIGNILDLISSTAETAFADVTDAVTAIAYQKYNKDFLYQEPIKTIIDYRRILLSQPWTRAATAEPIILGRFYSTDAEKPFTGYKNPNTFRRVDIGSVTLWRTFGNFLDFEPYSQAFLYVPYCGVKQLPMDIFGGHTINIKLNANNVTGELDALIFVDNIEWGSMHGEASEELPLMAETSMTNAATQRQLNYQAKQTEFSQTIGMFGSLAGASISAAMANPLGVIIQAGTAGVKKMQESAIQRELEYQIKHTKPEILAIQAGSASIEQANCLVPFIMLQSPVIIGAETPEQQQEVVRVYGKTKGFKCCEVGLLGNFSGLTKCSNAILDNISCTLTEKKMILEALQEGVILDWE